MWSDPVRTAVEIFVGNPFAVPRDVRVAAAETLHALDLPRILKAQLDAGDVLAAKAVLLAAGHAEAITHPESPARVLSPERMPHAVYGRLPRARGGYLRVVMAAGRCYGALKALAGDSALIRALRRHVWAACFGDSLVHALELEGLIRDHDVVILGETGTGKELVARAMLEAVPGGPDGGRAPQASINAAAVPETLIESELFGHVKGAFTGATDARAGQIRSADGGAIFLDEVGDLPAHTQVKLLRVIETNLVQPVGADRPHAVDLRYIAATHRDLEAMVERRAFRPDLYQRLAGHVIRLPALRERPEDIPAIGRGFVRQQLRGHRIPGQVERVERWLESAEARDYPWPGNVRELMNALRNLMLGLGAGLHPLPSAAPVGPEVPAAVAKGSANLKAVSQWYARKVLGAHDGNIAAAARSLGVDRSTLRRWLK